ncbi:MAG: recombinase family protein [Eubacterium sp.]|nr:recombinase family protein [Eubacterium sp.]
MNAGYVRLSKDDNKRNYSSIENQKLIIRQYASEHNLAIDRWYEDDGVSGYLFDRPGFKQLMDDLDKDIDTVIVKDFSRLGRHNAKILLLLDAFQERGKRLIVIDDHYNSEVSEDDTIGITTWFNERSVKDTSKKIRHALGAKQKEGTLMTQPPFGYRRTGKKRETLEIVPKEAKFIKLIYDLYIQGCGYRKISAYLTGQGAPTPSMIRRERELEEGINTNRHVAAVWSDGMVKDILDNDFYIGTFRLRKRARNTVHGKDKRVPKDKQYIFENHHPAVIDKMTYDLVQELKEKRTKSRYKGSRGQWTGSEIPNPFGSCLYCKDCGSKLTPIERRTSARVRKYYICSTYNTKGKRYCPKAHLIEEQNLMTDIANYIRMCRNALCEVIAAYDRNDFEAEQKTIEETCIAVSEDIDEVKKQLQTLFSQKIKDIAANPDNEDLIKESYDSIQQNLTARIRALESQHDKLKHTRLKTPDVKGKLHTALEVVDDVIQRGTLNRRDIEILIERIEVDENGLPEMKLKYSLSGFVHCSANEELNRHENEIILAAMYFIRDDNSGFTSAKYLSKQLTDIGYPKSTKSVLPYIAVMIEMGMIEPCENKRKPYTILKSKAEIEQIIANFKQSFLPEYHTEQLYT